MDTLLQDLRYALRQLTRQPGFTLVAVLTLALGIGANTAVFSVVNGVLLRPLPYPEPERVFYLAWQWARGTSTYLTAYKFDYWRRHTTVFEAMATHQSWATGIGTSEPPVEVRGLRVSDGFFRVNGIQPALGRAFLTDEQKPGGPRVVVLSDALWRSRFGAEPTLVGRPVRLGGEPHTVVGIMPAGFRFPESAGNMDFVVPLRLEANPRDEGQNYLVRARMRPDVTNDQVDAELRAVAAQFRREHPDLMDQSERGVRLLRYGDVFIGDTKRTLWVLLGAVGFVLLIACANVANLMLARGAARQREMAIRAAIGAGAGRMIRQLLTESLVLALAGAAVGLLVGKWGVETLIALAPAGLPRMDEITLDGPVLGFTFALGAITGILFGLVPAAQASRVDLAGPLRGSGIRDSRDRGRRRVGSLLAACEAGLSVVLLAGAALLLVSFFRLRAVDAGFEAEGLLTVSFGRTPREYARTEQIWRFEREVLERVALLPGVISAAAVSHLPLQGQYNFPMTVVGRPDATRGDVQWRAMSPGYFETLRAPVVRGRSFTQRDDAGAPPVVVVNQTFARKYFGGGDQIGQRIDIGTYQGREVIPGFDDPPREVVGVVADIRALGLGQTPIETMYIPRAQAPDAGRIGGLGSLVIRAVGSTQLGPAVVRVVRDIDPGLPSPQVRTMHEVIGASVAEERFNAALLSVFAGLALALTAIGIYGVVAYAVRQRTREVGIRAALGAQRGDTLRLILRQGMEPVAIGLGLGLLAAFGLTRLISGLLYGVSPGDPATFATVALLLAAVAILACYLPARRAARIDPVEALRNE
jgi:predicted permease